MYGLDMINTSVLGALGCDMNTFLRYFPAAETMYSLLVALAIGLILLGWVWNLFKNYGLGLGVDAEDPVKLTAKAILFIVLAYYADEIVNIALTIGGTPYAWILSSELPSLDFASFNSVLLTIIGVCANGGVALIVLILTLILAWNYIKLLFEAAERYVLLGVLVYTAPVAFAMGASLSAQKVVTYTQPSRSSFGVSWESSSLSQEAAPMIWVSMPSSRICWTGSGISAAWHSMKITSGSHSLNAVICALKSLISAPA